MMRLQSNIVNLAIIFVFIVVYLNGICLYWMEEGDDKRNPCGDSERYVPESASPIFLEE